MQKHAHKQTNTQTQTHTQTDTQCKKRTSLKIHLSHRKNNTRSPKLNVVLDISYIWRH